MQQEFELERRGGRKRIRLFVVLASCIHRSKTLALLGFCFLNVPNKVASGVIFLHPHLHYTWVINLF